MPHELTFDPHGLESLCRRYHIECLELFGSRARGDAREDSDVDLIVTFATGKTPGFAFFQLIIDLEELLGHHVDLFTRRSIESSINEFKKRSILSHTRELYRAA